MKNLFDFEMSTMSGISRRDEAIRLAKTGLSYAEVGRRLGITRERVRQIVTRNTRSKKPALPSDLMLKTSDVAGVLGVHVNTVRRWSDQGVLKAYRVGPRRDRKFRREDIVRSLAEFNVNEGSGNKAASASE